MSEQMDRMYALLEARPGPHWNPWPQKKVKGSELGQAMKDMAKFAHDNPGSLKFSKETIDILNSIGIYIKKDDKKKVKKLLAMLVKKGDVAQGTVNDIKNWLDFGEA